MAIGLLVVTCVLVLVLLVTLIVCCCWRYKLHKRKDELKARDQEQGVYTVKPKGCKCCGCWRYTCRSCRCCCVPSEPVQQVATAIVTPTGPTVGGGGSQPQQFGWTKDAYVYNTGGAGTGGCSGKVVSGGGMGPTPCSSVPVNFNNRWSSSSDGRLILNGGGVVSRMTPGVQTYGGIYPSMTGADQFQLRVGK